jgi:uncharacterized cysteine cluster protein YcgN (CxxCxxCC family)
MGLFTRKNKSVSNQNILQSNSQPIYSPSEQQFVFNYNNRIFEGIYMDGNSRGHYYSTDKGLLMIPEQAYRMSTTFNPKVEDLYKVISCNDTNVGLCHIGMFDLASQIKEKIVAMYKDELPAINLIKDDTAYKLYSLNERLGYKVTWHNLTDSYRHYGTLFEKGNTEISNNFNFFKGIVEDIKKCKILRITKSSTRES